MHIKAAINITVKLFIRISMASGGGGDGEARNEILWNITNTTAAANKTDTNSIVG